jgi:hypothetical protein
MTKMYEIVEHWQAGKLVRETIAPITVTESSGDDMRGIDESGDTFRGKLSDYYASVEQATNSLKLNH